MSLLREMRERRAARERDVRDQAREVGYWLGTVTSLDPLTVERDGGLGSIIAPESLTDPAALKVGSRVSMRRIGRRHMIEGAIHAGAGTPGVVVPEEPDSIRAGTWNILTTKFPPHDASWPSRRGPMAETIHAAGMSILAIQENNLGVSPTQGSDLLASVRASAPTGSDWKLYQPSINSLLYDGALWQMVESGTFPSVVGAGAMAWGFFRHRSTGREIVFASDHWHPTSPSNRLLEAAAAHRRMRGLSARFGGVPAIMGADTNDYPQPPDTTYLEPLALMRGSGDYSFRSLRADVPSPQRTEWPTWHNFSGPPWTEVGNSVSEWVDELFLLHGTYLAGGIWDTGGAWASLPSDHHLMWADIRLHDPVSDTGWRDLALRDSWGWRDVRPQERVLHGVTYLRGCVTLPTAPASNSLIADLSPEASACLGGARYASLAAFDTAWTSAQVGLHEEGPLRYKAGPRQYVYLDTAIALGGG